jgi:hypothetical protein
MFWEHSDINLAVEGITTPETLFTLRSCQSSLPGQNGLGIGWIFGRFAANGFVFCKLC